MVKQLDDQYLSLIRSQRTCQMKVKKTEREREREREKKKMNLKKTNMETKMD